MNLIKYFKKIDRLSDSITNSIHNFKKYGNDDDVSDNTLISLKQVTKFYRTTHHKKFILNDITIDLPKKNIAVLGKNGAGKSTLFRLLAGAEYPNKGQILVNGSISWPVGLTGAFQPSLTGRENVLFACRIYCLDDDSIQEKINIIKEFTELGAFFDMPVKKYSNGMRARLGFALSLVFDFDIYLVDEITSVGDAVFRQKADEAFKKLLDKAHVVMVSHDMSNIKKYCAGVLLLFDGMVYYTEDIDFAIHAYKTGQYEKLISKKILTES